MKHLLIGLLFASATCMGLQAQSAPEPAPREFSMTEGDTTYVMRRYVMVMLYTGKKANKYSKEEVAKIQEGHMANIGRLAEEGKLLVAGPMDDDTDLQGIFILDCADVAEAKTLVDTDPAVKAGRLRPEYHPWWTAKGTVIK
jgi:uncharacterized protein YciI